MMSTFENPISRRSVLTGALLGASGLLLAACGTADTATASQSTAAVTNGSNDPRGKHWKVVSQYYTSDNAFFQAWARGGVEAATALGMALEKQVDDANNDKVATIFRTASSRGFEGITSMIADPGISTSILKQAQTNRTYVANGWNITPWVTPWDIGDYWCNFITPHDVAGASALASILFDKMGGTGDFIHITGIPGNTVDILRTIGVDQALKKYPNIRMVARQPGGFSRGATTPVINALLTAHPNVKAVFCQNDDSAMGVLPALASRNRNDVLVVGIDAIPDMLQAIAQKRAFATWAEHGGYAGARLTVQVFDALAGVKPSATERMMWTGTFIVNTPEAAKEYTKVMSEKSNFPFDYALMSKALHPNDWDPQNSMAPMDFETNFAQQKPRPGAYKTPAAWQAAMAAGEVEKTTQEYKDHFKVDPFASIRKLCTGAGGKDITV